jgi:ATP-binding cassette subfamily B protein
VVYALVGLTGALVAIAGGITVGNLTSLLNYANQYTKPFNEISGVLTELQNALACAGRVFELIETPAETPDPDDAQSAGRVEGKVVIRDVNFSYNPEKPLIQNFSLEVKPGQRVAIVGPTGCGKTTLINLLMRFYDPQEGGIYLEGIDTKKMRRKDLRLNVGMVLQDTWLRSGTIRDNIAMGKPDATDAEIVEAAKQAHAHGFIRRLPQGYDTEIGESGGNLSQGEKQLLCIARVMLSLPPMLILDEATSSIDTRTEIRIQKAFDTMMKGRTSFVVAHRLSTIQEADVILVMRNGRIIEQGTHEELLEKHGFYEELYQSQFAH